MASRAGRGVMDLLGSGADAERAPARTDPSQSTDRSERRTERSTNDRPLPERLLAARERKGVDLYRAERDTKIRTRYLAALERGDYRELPGAVYTKGFLRNYAAYLGLDPDEALEQWRRERGEQAVPAPAIVPVRASLDAARPLTLSPSVIVAALMTFGVIVFGLYLGAQLVRFAKAPPLEITRPATAVVEAAASSSTYRLVGSTAPGATITVVAPGRDQPYRAQALADGSWSVEVDLRRGKNTFEIEAVDPETGKHSEQIRTVVINVPYLVFLAPTLTVGQPADGTIYANGAVPLEGRVEDAVTVTVSTTYLGPVDGPAPATPIPSATPEPDPSASPVPPVGMDVPVAEDGSFSSSIELTDGRWAVTITATSDQGKTASLTRTITVAYQGVTVVVTVSGGDAWVKVWTDDALDAGWPQSGRVMHDGEVATFHGDASVEIRTGSSGFTSFTVNGVPLGSLGRSGIPETWLFTPTTDPEQTQRR